MRSDPNMELGNLIFGHSRGRYAVEPRDIYESMFTDFLTSVGGDHYGRLDDADESGVFENDTFAIRPYYWGEDEAVAELPNFVFKPTWLEIRWYKYPMRDAYSNTDISPEEFQAILYTCAASLKGNKGERWFQI